MITLALTAFALAPVTPLPDPPPPSPGYITLLPNTLTQGDGARIVCAPRGGLCRVTNDSTPSYFS